MQEMSSQEFLQSTWEKEEDFQNAILDLATMSGWKVYFVPDWIWKMVVVSMQRHPRKGRRWAAAGFPDMVLCKPPRIMFWEIKSKVGTVRQPQKEWIAALQGCGIEARVVRPKDWDYVVSKLTEDELGQNSANQ